MKKQVNRKKGGKSVGRVRPTSDQVFPATNQPFPEWPLSWTLCRYHSCEAGRTTDPCGVLPGRQPGSGLFSELSI